MRRTPKSVVRPFPWTSLESMTRDDVASLRDLHALAAAHDAGAMCRALAELAGAAIDVRLRAVGLGARAIDPAVTVAFAAPDGGVAIALDVEPALAGALVARALKRASPRVVDPARGAAPSVAGAWAALIAAAVRRGDPARPLRVASAGAYADAAQARSALDDPRFAIALSLTVVVGDDAYLARLVVPRVVAGAAPSIPWPPASRTGGSRHATDATDATGPIASSLAGSLPAALSIVACVSIADSVDLAGLAPGDVWLPGHPFPFSLPASRAPGDRGAFRGTAWLAAPASARAVRAEIVDGDHLVLRGQVEDLAMTAPEDDGNALVENVGEVPVVVRVEIGVVEMRVREWAALRPGDVIPLARRIADPVILRAGASEIARGELVEIDGEVGVRVLASGGAS